MDASDNKLKLDKAEKSESGSREEKKARRHSGTHHLHLHHEKHEDKHDKKYYKKKYQEENKLKSELADVVKKLTATNEALRNEVEALKSQANAVTTTKEPEPVSFSKIDEKPATEEKSSSENPIENQTPDTPKPTSEPTGSYWDSVSNCLGTLYSYLPNFSGITSKIPNVPRILEPVPSHHDPVTKPKI